MGRLAQTLGVSNSTCIFRFGLQSIMSAESIISLLLGFPVGLISGLYTGLIVTRYARFAELRNEVLRVIRIIDFMENGRVIDISHDQDVSKLHLIASDFLFLGHRKAGEQTLVLSQKMNTINYSARHGHLSINKYGEHYSRWQNTARDLPGNKAVLWSLWGRI